MVDIETIKKEYDSMPDAALLALHQENYSLTEKANQALQQVLQHRGLVQEAEDFSTTKESSPFVENAFLQEQVMQWKKEGQDDAVIAARLAYQNIPVEQVNYLLKEMYANIREQVMQAEANRLGAFIRLCCGIAVFIIAFLAQLNRGAYFIGLMLVSLSIVQAAVADTKRSRLKSLLQPPARLVADY